MPLEILDLPHLPKMHFYPIFRHKNAFLPPVLTKKNPQENLNLKQKHPEICDQCQKLSELHLNVAMSSNRGEKVLNSIQIGCTQDIRVQHKDHKVLT